MKLETCNRYTIISDFNSLAQLYDERNTWVKSSSSIIVFRADDLCEISEEDLKNIQILSFFHNLLAITVFAAENIQKYPVDFLLLFDMRLSDKSYIFSGNENISDDALAFYKNSCGETAYYKLKKFLESDKKNPFESSLSVTVSSEIPFDKAVEQYIEKILYEKTPLQISAVVSCLIAMRNGNAEKSLAEESHYFYKLIKNKSEEFNGESKDN